MSETMKQKYQRLLGAEFGTVLHGIFQNWAMGWVRTNQIHELFGDRQTVKLLNTLTGGGLLGDVQKLMMDDLMLCVTRLTDPQQTGNKENLTVIRIPSFCDDPELRSEVQLLVDKAVHAAEPARKYRNQQISHTDLGAEREPAKLVPRATLEEAEKVLNTVHSILDLIQRRMFDAQLHGEVILAPGRAETFIHNARYFAKAVRIVNAVVGSRVTDDYGRHAETVTFLQGIGEPDTWDNIRTIAMIRRLAERLGEAEPDV